MDESSESLEENPCGSATKPNDRENDLEHIEKSEAYPRG